MIMLDREKNETARAYAFRVLSHNIINLEFEPGSAIIEKDISAALNLSRTPVREALIELTKSGLVNIIPQKGSYISKIDYDIIEESRFFRLALELAILKIACKGIPDNYLIKLKSNIVKQELCVNMVDHTIFQNLDNVFHKLLFESVGKQWSYDIISPQMAYFDRFRILTLKALKIDKIVNEHKSILDAIENHDFQSAKNIMTKHLGKKDSEKEEILALYPEYFI